MSGEFKGLINYLILVDYFNKEINYNCLTTFEDFNYSFNDIHIMKTYNKLIVQFIIDFIKYS